MKGLITISIGVTCVIGGIVIKKLKDIHEEIKYFEYAKGVLHCKKDYERIDKEYWKNYFKKKETESK